MNDGNVDMDFSQDTLLEKLEAYGKSDFYPFHMPGHKRREIPFSSEGSFPNPYAIDITEIDGFDNLHHAEGILKKSMEQAAKIYGAEKTYYLVNGSTCGILSAVCGITENGGKILMARNCHKSAYHALILNRLSVEYVYPDFLESFGINGGIRAEDVKHFLSEHEVQAVLVVSPTYEGVVSDIQSIAEVSHSFGVPLIVDEAHGAHFSFGDGSGKFPESALKKGADVVIQSLHKTLPSFTQTAILHVQGNLVDRRKIERYLGIFQSSSPSYIFMAGLEQCLRYMETDGRQEMTRYGKRMEKFYEDIQPLRILKVLGRKIISEPSVYDWDMSKIVISTMGTGGFSGEALGQLLRKKYHLEMEMCAPDYVVAMTSLMDTEEGLERLSKALLEIDRELTGSRLSRLSGASAGVFQSRNTLPQTISKMIIAEALETQGRPLKLSESVGMISKEFVYLYPPGIPLLAPGELITENILEKIGEYQAAGLSVQGLEDETLSTILTVAE